MTKIFNISKLSDKITKHKKRNKKIVLCHGAFDLFHPGHLAHLEQAKKNGDILVVSITKDKHIKKGINSPFYKEEERIKFLSNINLVDYVCVTDSPSAIPTLRTLKPDFYCKGEEYKKSDEIGNLKEEKNFCKKNNIEFIYVGKVMFSSNKIISEKFFESYDKNLNKIIKKNIIDKKVDLDKSIRKLKNLKVLIIGEIILDKYTYVTTRGTSPKSSTLSSTIDYIEMMPGGALATYRFIKQFTNNIKLLSVLETSLISSNKKIFSKELKKDLKFFDISEKLIKERIVEYDKISNIKKILTVNHFNQINLDKKLELKLNSFLNKNLRKFDMIIVQDFGHGLITKKLAKIIQNKSKFLSINVQTNSLNYGFNLINKKFKRVDLLTLDKRELELYSGYKNILYEKYLKKLSTELKSKFTYLTCGNEFSLGKNRNEIFKIRTIGTDVVDTMGAGDIFHAMSSLMSASQKNVFLSLFLAQISGALAVKIPGNRDFPKINQIKRTFNLFVKSIK